PSILNDLIIKKITTPNYNFHVFYYAWYGNPVVNGKYLHWNHRILPKWNAANVSLFNVRHQPPDDIGSTFFPKLGLYSSKAVDIINNHMKQIRNANIGVLALSWYPPGTHDDEGEDMDDLVTNILDHAQLFQLKVCFHIEPFKGRDEKTMRKNIKYIIDKYGSHPAFYRMLHKKSGQHLPIFYVYDSYLIDVKQWKRLLHPRYGGNSTDNISVRGTQYDAIFIGLIVERNHLYSLRDGGFDGYYTYFGSDGFSFGSSLSNWMFLAGQQSELQMFFIPSVAPGYNDEKVRPWNNINTKSRLDGKYYENAFSNAYKSLAEVVSITSFNEWHEGTQIEEAVPNRNNSNFRYLDYSPHDSSYYLAITRKWIDLFSKRK
ncbi:hypothetical protein HELRODRAFT_132254, partial [Helobdella robusta]|uniref:Mannosidase endo-alpha n=1 Tax=Helobdella robusta TaxID=6412 RepID=T1EHX5_HELRO